MNARLHHHPQPPTGLLSGLIELNRLVLEASKSKVVWTAVDIERSFQSVGIHRCAPILLEGH